MVDEILAKKVIVYGIDLIPIQNLYIITKIVKFHERCRALVM